ncbi:hypothetical protein LTR85_009446 [Meristemomyces frigidus]|nr:hypothetical protein LTR85_009446 [Meristemomyces frigidus]
MPTRVRRAALDESASFMRPRTEAARERDAFRFLHPWVEANQPAHINRAAFPHNDDPMPEGEGCSDTALAALTQLATLRMFARRALVTLISTDVEYVLAESTKSMSLQYDVFDDPKDFTWVGTSSFLRAEGVNDVAVYAWRKARRLREVPEDDGFWYTDGLSPHSLIISDVRCHSKCRGRPFVTRAPWLRFFCSVPLRDLQGSVIGSLTILDDKPRYGVSMNEMAFMEDMADTITEHLEATIVRSQRQRSERLIQGLSLFVNGKDSLRHWWLTQDDARRHRAGRYQVQDTGADSQNARLEKEFGISELAHTSTSEGDASDPAGRDSRICKLNGFSTRNKSTLKGSQSSDHQFNLSDSNLASLIRRYPHGKIFNFEDSGDLYSSSGDDAQSAGSATSTEGPQARKPHKRQSQDAKQLGKIMVGARTIAFYPIWDNAIERWRTCLFVWSTTPLRFFDPIEDITYMSAFSHSLVAELARLETKASDMAKGTFISSISHELRSPLHGVLAGAEFLMESDGLSPFQSQMVSTISMAGRTLLDTVNHILDFGKLSNFSGQQRKERAAADATRHLAGSAGDRNEMGVTSSVDLARLTEEVCETVISARRFERRSQTRHTFAVEGIEAAAEGHLESSDAKQQNSVSVSIDIDRRDSWMIDISPGSWTRILTNLVGNALKYTPDGTVAVKLSAGEVSPDRGARRGTVILTVKDTGIGMSPQFLANGLYTPFKQANSHSTGTGLGLSIVKQIAKDLRADLDVESKLGKGTNVAFSFKATFVPGSHSEDVSLDSKLLRATRDLGVRHFHLLTLEDEGYEISDRTRAIGVSVRNMATQWMHCETSSGPRIPETSDIVCAMVESDLLWLADERHDELSSILFDLASRRALPLILADSVGSVATDLSFEDFPIEPIFLHQAIGPRKLMRSIVAAKNTNANGTERPISPDSVTPRLLEDFYPGGKGLQSEDGHFPWHSGTPSPAEQDGRSGTDPPVRPQLPRPRISRRYQSALQSSRLPPTSADSSASSEHGEPTTNGNDIPAERSTVLLVEDNEINMKLLVALMKKSKLEYECAGDGLQALNAYTATPSKFLLVLMDITMPVMDGFTCTAKIRELERKKKLPRCTIVALTGVTSHESREAATQVGIDKYFTKPIRMKDVSALVTEVR